MREAASRDLSGPHRTARPAAGASFAWLELADPGALVDDVVDTLRALRCADALRQRGTALKTSGNYEIFVDERSGNAIYALRPDDGHLYLLEVPDPIAAGEANLASSQLDADGDLRISFHHGAFRGAATMLKAANSAALVVSDIQADAIGSFAREDRASRPAANRRGADPDRGRGREPGFRRSGARGAQAPQSGGSGPGQARRLPRCGLRRESGAAT